ncbi:hypothetical protein [Acidovorax sp.]|uniref:hypothetical protein n=1 Tax=Acidovorax sp. TaxID=1872122 RepID=UPI0031D4E0F9
MFDTYVLRHGGSQHHTHTIIENRAPTDESLRLLKEMEKAAQDKMLGSIRLDNCPIDCVIHAHQDCMGLDLQFIVRLKINSQVIEIKHIHRRQHGSLEEERQAVISGLNSCVAARIAAELLGQAFARADRWVQGIVR